MNIVDIKGHLCDVRVLSIMALSQYMPTAEKLSKLADKYQSDPAIFAFGCQDNAFICGAVILKHICGGTFEIVSIAVDPGYRLKGIASQLVAFAADALNCAEIKAETDDDAVDFYRKCGFQIESLGEKYPGVVRYLCSLRG